MNTMYYQISSFGKLPRFGDFVRYNSGGPEIRIFEKWIQEGLYYAQKHYDREWPRIYAHSPGYQFLFNHDGADKFLLGALRPSHDKSERRYPFVVTLRIAKDIAADTDVFAYFPVMLSRFLQQTSPVLEQAELALTPQDLAVETERLNDAVEVDMEAALAGFKDYLQNTSLSQFWGEVLGNADDLRRFRLIKNLADILLPLRGHPPRQLALGLRFPLGSNGSSLHHAVCFWILAVARMLGDPPLNPNAFWGGPGGASDRFLFLFLRPPASKNLIQLVCPEAENDGVCHLEEEGKNVSPDAALSSLSPELGPAFAEGRISLGEFLGLI
jgi:type VI secretion system ImpM family protein